MWRATLTAFLLWGASSWAHAQEARDAAAMGTAIERVCAPYVLDAVAEADIAALEGAPQVFGSYRRLGDEVSVSFTMLGPVRVCTVIIEQPNAEAYRAPILEAAPRWRTPLTYRGDFQPGIGFRRAEVFCPNANGPRVSWTLLSNNGGQLRLAIMSAVSRHCTAS